MKRVKFVLYIIGISMIISCSMSTIKNENKVVKCDTTSLKIDSVIVEDTIIFSKVSIGVNKTHTWKYEWNKFISDEITLRKKTFIDNDSLYENDILRLCPTYYILDENQKIAWWTLLFASIAYYESAFNPVCRYQEPASLNYVYSEGLLQLSYIDKAVYKDCLIDESKHNIMNPEVNLRTGVIILDKQLRNRKMIFTKKSFYWSVLTKKQNEIIEFFNKNIAELYLCRCR